MTCRSSRTRARAMRPGDDHPESCVQMIVALCELGILPDDSRFVKNGKTMLDNLMTFYLPGNGFLHTATGRARTRWPQSRHSMA
ncbi:MAG: hypothetical protein ACLSAF_22045 [Intestinimonas sp.]